MPRAIAGRSLSPRLEADEPIQRCGWPSCRAACCVYGTWLSEAEMHQLQHHSAQISPHLPEAHRAPDTWFGEETDEDELRRNTIWHTRVVPDADHYGGSACVFLRADFKCGLQVASEAMGQSAWFLKPYYCILHPLDLDDQGRLTLDEARLLVDEPASCLRNADSAQSLKHLFAEEIEYLGP